MAAQRAGENLRIRQEQARQKAHPKLVKFYLDLVAFARAWNLQFRGDVLEMAPLCRVFWWSHRGVRFQLGSHILNFSYNDRTGSTTEGCIFSRLDDSLYSIGCEDPIERVLEELSFVLNPTVEE